MLATGPDLNVCQDESENLDLYQDIDNFGSWNQNKKTSEDVVHTTHVIINTQKNLLHSRNGVGCIGIIIFIFQKLTEKGAPQVGWFFHTFLMFTSNHVVV